MITKSGDTVSHCNSESMVYIQNPITPFDSQRIKEVALSVDRDASHAEGGGVRHHFEFVLPRLETSAQYNF